AKLRIAIASAGNLTKEHRTFSRLRSTIPARFRQKEPIGTGGNHAPSIMVLRGGCQYVRRRGGASFGRGDAKIRRHSDLHNSGRCAAELRRAARGDLRTIHSAAPFYSTLIRINPDNPGSTTDIVCDLCTEMPTPTDAGTTYTFKIRQDVKFHNGDKLTAADIAAILNKIAFPPAVTLSLRSI